MASVRHSREVGIFESFVNGRLAERPSKNQPIDLAWYGVLNRIEMKPSIPPLPNPSPARGEGLLAVASLVGRGITWTPRLGLSF